VALLARMLSSERFDRICRSGDVGHLMVVSASS
jgi:hypothetical protein